MLLACLALQALAAWAQLDPAAALRSVGFEQHLEGALPLQATFRDETGESVTLAQYFGRRPVVILPGYYTCPNLCSTALASLGQSLRLTGLLAGSDYEVLSVSIAPGDTPQRAQQKRFESPLARSGWHFLTGDDAAIAAIADAIGFRYAYDPRSKQYVHPAGFVLATPEGRIARYYLGVGIPPGDLKEGLLAAARGRSASPLERIALLCSGYDGVSGRYGGAIMVFLRGFALATTIGLMLFLVRSRRAGRRR